MMRRKEEKTSLASSLFRLRYAKGILMLCVAALGLFLAVNLFAAQLPTRYTHFDTTNIKLYSISDYTKQVVSSLEDEIQIYLVAQYGSEDKTVQELLARYDELSSKIQVTQIDPVLRPDVLEQYASSMETNSVIVTNGDRFQIVASSSMYVDSYRYVEGTGNVYDSYFAGEQEITGAIAFVTSGDLPKLYLLTGHGEASLPDYIEQAVAQENIEMEPLNLGTVSEVPSDADILFLYAPERDLLEQEAEMILSYLKNGGRMMIVGGYITGGSPNLDEVVAYYGIERIEGTVIERNTNYFLDQYPSYILANIASHSITQPLLNQGFFVVSPVSQGLVPMASVRSSITSSALLYTTDSALSISSTGQDGEAEATALGPFTIGLAIEEETSSGTARLVWFTSPYLLLEDVNELSSGANYDLFLNSLSWMYDFDEGISIRTKNLMMDYLTIRSSQGMVLGAAMIAVIPMVILIVGGVVLFRRRRR